MRVVVDTNVYISAVLGGGTCAKVLQKLSTSGSFVFISPSLVYEVRRVLREKFHMSASNVRRVEEDMKSRAFLIHPKKRVREVKGNKGDNRILECAYASKADHLITGDKKHLLALKSFKGTKIISPSEFLKT